jgi:serine phosphatase RsbU (regulator of sigma subunit)
LPKSYETLVFQEKKALEAWKSAAERAKHGPNETMEEIVWTLLTLCGDYLNNPTPELEKEIADEAHEITHLAITEIGLELAAQIYRDDLLDAITRNLAGGEEWTPQLLRFANIVSDALCHAQTESLRRTIRHQRMDNLTNELRVAKGIQQRLVPKHPPKIEGFDFAGRLIPAAEIGGDYWSVKNHPEEGIITAKLADVSGHGIAAATLVSAVKFISGGYFQSAKTASWVMEQTNRVLTEETPSEVLVSMIYAWIYSKNKEVTFVNAGHEPVFICNAEGCLDIPPTGPVLGVSEAKYGEIRRQLAPNDIIFFGSDGLTEAGRGDQFGLQRLKHIVAENRRLSADALADTIIDKVIEYAGTPHDDLSLVIVKVTEEVLEEE